MKRLWVCCAILAFMLVMASGWVHYLKKSSERLSNMIDEAEQLAEQRSPEAAEAIDELCSYWESFASAAAFFESSSTLLSISVSAAQREYIYAKENDEFFSECEVIRNGADRIFRSNLPFLPNR